MAAQGQKRGPDTPSNPRRLTTDPCNKVLIRDNYRCVVCNRDVSGKGEARVDHIKPLRAYPHLALSLICTVASSLGAVVGYVIGYGLWGLVGARLVELYGQGEGFTAYQRPCCTDRSLGGEDWTVY